MLISTLIRKQTQSLLNLTQTIYRSVYSVTLTLTKNGLANGQVYIIIIVVDCLEIQAELKKFSAYL